MMNKTVFSDELKQELIDSYGNKEKMLAVLKKIREIASKEIEVLFKAIGATDEEIALAKKVDANIFPLGTTNEEILQYLRDHKEELSK